MQLSELAALLSLAAVDDASKRQLPAAGGLESSSGKSPSLFAFLKQKPSLTVQETQGLLQSLDLKLHGRPCEEAVVQSLAQAMANGSHSIPSATVSLFLCFVVSLPTNEKRTHVVEAITRQCLIDCKEEMLDAIPALIAISYAASVLMGPALPLGSQRMGSLSFSTTQSLLRGVAETTFHAFVSESRLLRVLDLFAYLESCAKNLSDLMFQHTLLEQEVFRNTSSAESMRSMISQSKMLMEKWPSLGEGGSVEGVVCRYLKDPVELESVMNEVWRDSVAGYAKTHAPESSRRKSESSEVTSIPEPSHCLTDSDAPLRPQQSKPRSHLFWKKVSCAGLERNGETEISVVEPEPVKREMQNQNDLFQGISQIFGDLGQRLVMLTLGRFLLFLALLYATAAFGFVLVKEVGLSIALSLTCTFALSLILAIAALYCAGRGCNQAGDDASKKICGLLQTNPTRVAVNELLRENGAPGLQPMVRTVVDSLVPQQSTCSMIPIERQMKREVESEDEASPKGLRPAPSFVRPPRPQSLNVTGSTTRDDSMASKLRSIVSTVGKIAAHFNNDSSQSGQCSARNESQPSSSQMSCVELSGLEVRKQTAQDTFLNAYPHMRNSS